MCKFYLVFHRLRLVDAKGQGRLSSREFGKGNNTEIEKLASSGFIYCLLFSQKHKICFVQLLLLFQARQVMPFCQENTRINRSDQNIELITN